MTKETLQPSDLRIGNWFEIHDKYYQVYGLLANGVIEIDPKKVGYCIESIKGVPLTPEILEKWCGVKKDGFGSYNIEVHRYNKHFRLLKFSGDYLYLIEGLDYNKPNEWDYITIWNKDVMKQFYLHQLQNLYYCLTGVEMEVKII